MDLADWIRMHSTAVIPAEPPSKGILFCIKGSPTAEKYERCLGLWNEATDHRAEGLIHIPLPGEIPEIMPEK